MARIRSIKPDFWTDGKICRLSSDAALFFIALWNFADDSGFFTLDSLELALKMGRWRSQEVSKLTSALVRAGLVKTSRGVGVGLVLGWEHQRIDKPRPSKWEGVEIQWDDAPSDQESSATVPRKDRIGEDRIGKDRRGEDINAPTCEKPPQVSSSRVARANPRGCISEFSGDPILERLLSGVTNALQATWLATYCDETEWIKQELKKANAWIVANPRKAPKDFGRFMTNWLAQGWESHRKSIPSRRLTTSELNMQSIGDLYRKVQAEG